MYKTSTDYERLWKLIQPTEDGQCNGGILFRPHIGAVVSPWFLCPCSTDFIGGKDAFVAHCKKSQIEFIDPASQQKPTVWRGPAEKPEEDDCTKLLMIWRQPEDAEFLADIETAYMFRRIPERCIVQKWAYVRDLELLGAIEKTPAELAAGEMVALLSKCNSCINYLLHGVVDSPVIGEAENTMIEIDELLKKARGEE